MISPRLTIVVPTYNRPTLLPRALDSALGQTAPCKVIVADDGETDRTAEILASPHYAGFADRITHLKTGATDAWSNWRAGAEAVDTEFLVFHQDDDVISPHYVERVLFAFDEVEKQGGHPHVWFGRLECADVTATMAVPGAGNGPWVPMRSLHGICEPAHYSQGQAVAATMYFTSWSLSPALAYRTGPEFRAALAAMPDRADMYVERIIPAEMAVHGGFIADPAVVGYWAQHGVSGAHLSHAQWPDQPRQTKLLIAHLDGLLDTLPDWERQFAAWCGVVPPMALMQWMGTLDTTEEEGGLSRHGGTVREIMWTSMEARVKITAVSSPFWKRAANWLKSTAARLVDRPDPGGPPTVAAIVQRDCLPTDKCSVHSYGKFYDRELAPYRDRPVRLLEIGIADGGSVALWQRYFSQAEIVGVDAAPIDHARRLAPGATLICADAYDPDAVRGTFDIIIDDGPHTLESMIDLILIYLPRLRPGGLMVIEDVQDPAWFEELAAVVPGLGYSHEAIDLRHIKGRYDDAIFVVRATQSIPVAKCDLAPSAA